MRPTHFLQTSTIEHTLTSTYMVTQEHTLTSTMTETSTETATQTQTDVCCLFTRSLSIVD